jgi:hypothetical protein
MGAMPEARTVWAISPASNPRKGVRGTLALEAGTPIFTPSERGSPGFRVRGGEVLAATKAPSSPIIELQLASYPGEVLLYFAEPSFFFVDWHDLYKMAFADVFLGDAVNEWLGAFLHPQPEHVAPEWTPAQEQRLAELERLREERGLSDEEANELGRLYAEREDEAYGNVDTRPHPDLDRTERPWRWTDVNHPGEGLAWVAGTLETGTNERAHWVLGKRPPPHSTSR